MHEVIVLVKPLRPGRAVTVGDDVPERPWRRVCHPPGGCGAVAARRDRVLVDWIAAAAPHARRVVSVCTEAVLAAQAGLLDGCVATTHWAFASQMANEFRSVTVDPDPMLVRSSQKVWTAAGVTAGVDLALSLVEDDYGTECAQTVARYLLMYCGARVGKPRSPPRCGCRVPAGRRSAMFRRRSRPNPAVRTALPGWPAAPR